MASAYFPFLRKKSDKTSNPEQGSKSEQILKDGDENLLEKHVKSDTPASEAIDATPTKITNDGGEQQASHEDKPIPQDQVVVPEQPTSTRNKNKDVELPSQEEAEALTGAFNANMNHETTGTDENKEKRTWNSFLSSLTSSFKRAESAEPNSTSRPGSEQTWSKRATSYVQSLPGIRASEKGDGKSAETTEGNTTDAKQEGEVSALLDQLKLSSFNNHLFARGSDDLQAVYAQFSQVLKDIINGVPTAYDDLENLMRTAGPRLEARFKDMPPFLQTLVKNLPMKLAPELMAVAGATKPEDNLRTNLEAASQTDANRPVGASSASSSTAEKDKKKKRHVPGLKSLVNREGMVATMLRNVVTFLQTRFPFLASTTNIVMSLAVFILMFVFWYSYKRGREVRLEKEAEMNPDGKHNAEGPEVSSNDDESDFMEKSVDQTESDEHKTQPQDMPDDGKQEGNDRPLPAE